MKRLLVNDCLSALPGHRTFWNDLRDWFDFTFVWSPFDKLVAEADGAAKGASLIVRNATYFGPLEASKTAPTISLLQDIIQEEGPQREMQNEVIDSSKVVVFNSAFTESKYKFIDKFVSVEPPRFENKARIIPLPVDFSLFEPGNPMGLQQALSLPDGCICWVGASQGAAGQVKGWDLFLSIVRQNPDLHFVAVFKDAAPEYVPPNMRTFVKVSHEDLVKIIGACRVGLCTSRMESQHLSGIEMGACGLPIVAPEVGTYFRRHDIPGELLHDTIPAKFGIRIRRCLDRNRDPQVIRDYWRKEFDRPIIRSAWAKLIEEVE